MHTRSNHSKTLRQNLILRLYYSTVASGPKTILIVGKIILIKILKTFYKIYLYYFYMGMSRIFSSSRADRVWEFIEQEETRAELPNSFRIGKV